MSTPQCQSEQSKLGSSVRVTMEQDYSQQRNKELETLPDSNVLTTGVSIPLGWTTGPFSATHTSREL